MRAPSGATDVARGGRGAGAGRAARRARQRILKGDVVVASVDYETVKVGDRGVVGARAAIPAMSRADLRVLVDFDGKAA